MSDENENLNPAPAPESKPEAQKRPDIARDMNVAIKEHIQNMHPEVKTTVVRHFAQIEQDKRVKAVTTAFETIQKMEKEINNTKPDGPEPGLDASGKPLSERGWTKNALEKLKKDKETLQKWKNALAAALPVVPESQVSETGEEVPVTPPKPDFQKLYELTGGNK